MSKEIEHKQKDGVTTVHTRDHMEYTMRGVSVDIVNDVYWFKHEDGAVAAVVPGPNISCVDVEYNPPELEQEKSVESDIMSEINSKRELDKLALRALIDVRIKERVPWPHLPDRYVKMVPSHDRPDWKNLRQAMLDLLG